MYRAAIHPEEFRFSRIDQQLRDKAVYHPQLRNSFGIWYERKLKETRKRYSHLKEADR